MVLLPCGLWIAGWVVVCMKQCTSDMAMRFLGSDPRGESVSENGQQAAMIL